MAADDAADAAFWQARLTAVEAQIVAAETKLAQLQASVAGYEINTGQTTQRVTNHDILKLQASIDDLLNRRDIFRARLYGGSTHIVPNC